MDKQDESILLANSCSVLIFDLSHIIWLREIPKLMKDGEKNKEVLVFSENEAYSWTIYKCFKKQFKNLQKYSSLITKFREAELFIDEIEDRIQIGNLIINNDLVKQISQETEILKKCYIYSSKMGSIMHRSMTHRLYNEVSIMATVIENFKKDSYYLLKNETVEIIKMKSEISWKIKTKCGYMLLVSPIYLKVHSDSGEKEIIKKLLERMEKIINGIYKKDLTKEKKLNENSLFFNDNENIKKIEHISKFFNEFENTEFMKVGHDKINKSQDQNNCSRNEYRKVICIHQQFQLEISDKVVTNKEKIHTILFDEINL